MDLFLGRADKLTDGFDTGNGGDVDMAVDEAADRGKSGGKSGRRRISMMCFLLSQVCVEKGGNSRADESTCKVDSLQRPLVRKKVWLIDRKDVGDLALLDDDGLQAREEFARSRIDDVRVRKEEAGGRGRDPGFQGELRKAADRKISLLWCSAKKRAGQKGGRGCEEGERTGWGESPKDQGSREQARCGSTPRRARRCNVRRGKKA